MNAGDCLAIVLVDKCKLRYTAEPPPDESHRSGVPSCCCGLVRFSYRGHYIVLTSWVEGAQAFRVEDPALTLATYITAASLDRARISYGTDEDILVVSRCTHQKHVLLTSQSAMRARSEATAYREAFDRTVQPAPNGGFAESAESTATA